MLGKCVLTRVKTGVKLEPALGTWEDKIEHLSSCGHVVHTTAKQVISRRRKNENVFKMSKHEKCTCKACKNTVFHCQICKFVGFLLLSSSWLLKLRNTNQHSSNISNIYWTKNTEVIFLWTKRQILLKVKCKKFGPLSAWYRTLFRRGY